MIKDKEPSLPTGWAWAPIIELGGKPQYGWTTKAQNEGNLKFLRTTDISSGEVNWDTVPFCKDEPADVEKYLVAKNDIVVSRAGSVGKSFIIRKPLRAVFASYMVRIRPKTNPNYLYHFMQSLNYWVQIWDKSTGIAIPNVNGTKLGQIELPVPPLAEQERIVDKIDELFSDIEAGERAIAQARAGVARYRKAILKAAVTGELTADWRSENPTKESAKDLLARILTARYEAWEKSELTKLDAKGKARPETEKQWEKFRARYKRPVEAKALRSKELPDSWVNCSVDSCHRLLTSGSRGWAKFYSDKGAVFVRAQNIKHEFLDLTDIAYVDLPSKSEGKRTALQVRDILITITGANVTKTAIVRKDIGEAYVNQHVALLRPLIDHTASYLTIYLQAPAGGKTAMNSFAYGAGKPGLSLTNIAEINLALPPLEEQAEIVNRVEQALSKAAAVEATLDAQSRAAKALKQAVLKTAFEGKLVPQNKNDEPASELLKRIKAAS